MGFEQKVSTDLSLSIHALHSIITKSPPRKPTSFFLDDQEPKTTTMRESSTVSTELSLNILGPVITSSSIKQQQQPFFVDVDRKVIPFKKALTLFQEGNDKSSVSTELSLSILHRPLIIPSTTLDHHRNLPFEKRSIPEADSVNKTAKRKFVKEENQNQEFARHMADGVSTKKRKTSKNIRKKKEDRPVVASEVTERLHKFIKNKMNGSDLKLLIQKI